MTSISGSLRFHRSRATRQLCAPKSTATRGFRFTIGFIVVCSPSSNLSCDREEWSLSKKCLRQASIHWDQVTSRTTRLRAGKKQYGCGAILGINRLMRQRTLRIEIRQETSEVLIRRCLIEGNRIFGEGSDDSIPRKHCRTFDDSGRADSIHPDLRSE